MLTYTGLIQHDVGVCPSLCRMPECCGSNAGVLGWYAASTGNQISSRLLSARSANALLELPRAEGEITAGGCDGQQAVELLFCLDHGCTSLHTL